MKYLYLLFIMIACYWVVQWTTEVPMEPKNIGVQVGDHATDPNTKWEYYKK